jgi:radical SAM protein with 4Fe4S-binding SPASM domain
MSWNLFRKIVKDLHKFPRKIRMINFYKDGSPLVNNLYPEMARELIDAGVAERVWFKTNGLLLSPDLNRRIAAAGFGMVGISVIGVGAKAYRDVAGTNIDYDRFVANVADLYSRRGNMKIYVKMADVGFPPEDIDKFYRDFEDKCDYIAVENLHGWSRTDLKDFTLGTRPSTFDGVPNKAKIVCPWPLYQLSINWNGACQSCNEDWSWTNIVGDASRESLVDIWNGEAVRRFQMMHLRGDRFNNAACGTCWQTQSTLDDVDSYRAAILERLTNGR